MVNHACMPARADRAAASTPTAHSLAYARFVPSFARRRRSRQRRNIRQRPADTAAYHTERQAITCRVVSRGGVVPYEALIVGVHADGLCFDAQKTDATEFRSILFRSTNKCIEQQVLLNEERERIGTIVGRNKSLNVKNLTQEVLSLRKELDVTKHNAKAAMWKLQEVSLVSKQSILSFPCAI